MSDNFSRETFRYFEQAKRNRMKREWFEKNRAVYEEHVRAPFLHLIELFKMEVGPKLPRINIKPSKIARPLLRGQDNENGVIRTKSTAFFAETATSQFEWNPGIYISMGADADDNVMGLGLYMVSSRQMKRMRAAVNSDFETFDSILKQRSLKSRWGKLQGELYKRFPRGYDENSPAANYLMHKQFFLSQELKRSEITKKDFAMRVVKDVKAAIPFLSWIRTTVGTYRPNTARHLEF